MRYLYLFLASISILISITSVVAQEDEVVTPQDLAPEQGQFLDINGVEIYYEDYGERDDPTVMLLHGFGGSTFTWRGNIQPLVDEGYRVVAFDRPPFGLSDKGLDTDYSTSAQLGYMEALMDVLQIERATLVGHSAGGGIIAYFSTAFPDRVNSLVFVAGAVPIPRETSETEGNSNETGGGLGGLFELAGNLDPTSPIAQNLVRSFLTPETFVEILSSAYYDPSIITDEVATGYQLPLRVTGWETGFLAYFATRDDTLEFDLGIFTALDVPIMIMWGAEDTWVPIEVGEALIQIFPNAIFARYPETGHLPMEENPEQFNTDLIDFLATVYE